MSNDNTDPLAEKPFWQRPVPPIHYPGDPSVNGRPPVDTYPLADGVSPLTAGLSFATIISSR